MTVLTSGAADFGDYIRADVPDPELCVRRSLPGSSHHEGGLYAGLAAPVSGHGGWRTARESGGARIL